MFLQFDRKELQTLARWLAVEIDARQTITSEMDEELAVIFKKAMSALRTARVREGLAPDSDDTDEMKSWAEMLGV